MARYALVVSVEARRRDPAWPVGTLIVNLLGCLLLGVLVSSTALESGDLRTGLIAALGSFTTVSAFVLESWQRRARRALVLGYFVGSLIGCLAMFSIGLRLA